MTHSGGLASNPRAHRNNHFESSMSHVAKRSHVVKMSHVAKMSHAGKPRDPRSVISFPKIPWPQDSI